MSGLRQIMKKPQDTLTGSPSDGSYGATWSGLALRHFGSSPLPPYPLSLIRKTVTRSLWKASSVVVLETVVELMSRKDARTRSKRRRMAVGLSEEEHLFAQWVNRWISPSHLRHRVNQHFLVSNDFSGIKQARSQQGYERGNASHREAFPQIRTQDGGHRNKFLGATDSRSDS
jgi:hypothetical protein